MFKPGRVPLLIAAFAAYLAFLPLVIYAFGSSTVKGLGISVPLARYKPSSFLLAADVLLPGI